MTDILNISTNFDILKSKSHNLSLFFHFFSGDIFQNLMNNLRSLADIAGGQFLDHGHHQILVILVDRCTFHNLTLLVHFLYYHSYAVKIHQVVVELSMQ